MVGERQELTMARQGLGKTSREPVPHQSALGGTFTLGGRMCKARPLLLGQEAEHKVVIQNNKQMGRLPTVGE